jgi:trimeric autotransporter adhesin
MKPKLTLITLLLTTHISLLTSQIPQGFNYQAIARGSDGKELAGTSLQVQVSILSDTTGFKKSGTGTYIWEEQHSVTTNNLGLFILMVGDPSATFIQGSAGSFSAINWKTQPLYIGTKIYYQSSWKYMGAAKLLSTPYSMVSGELAGPVKKLEVTGATANMDEALFEVRNKDGQTIFAVYNEGVRIYVDDGLAAKATNKGGFAIGSFGTAKAPSQELFIVSADSIRAYIGTNKAKPVAKGGFAIGGFTGAKAVNEEYLRVTRDSTRVYVNEAAAVKGGTKGGFAIGGFTPAKGAVNNLMNLTPSNFFIGQHAGRITSGLYNNFIGFQSGYSNTSGTYNSFLGHNTGYSNTTGNYNSFLGFEAGYSNTTGFNNSFLGYMTGRSNLTGTSNTFVGTQSGLSFTSGTGNTFIGVGSGITFNNGMYNVFIGSLAGAGYQFPAGATGGQNNVAVGTGAGYRLNTGSNNVFVGNFAGLSNTSASNNIFIGFQSGYVNSTGDYNLFLGYQSGYSNSAGFNNSFLGYQAGFSNSTGNWNIFLGNRAGYSNTTGVQNLFIGDGSGYDNTTGSQNVFLGLQAGTNNTTGGGNVFLGWNAGLTNTEGFNNAFFGLGAGYSNTIAPYNTFIGFSSGFANQTGQFNTYLGSNSGRSNTGGSGNVAIGESSGYSVTNGSNNTFIGLESGYSLTSGTGNIFIGSGAGSAETVTSNRLYIENSAASKTAALIYGEFDNNFLTFNGNVGINRLSPATRLDIAGGNWNVAGASEGDFRIGDANYRLKIGVATTGNGAGDVRLTSMGGTNRLILGGNGVDALTITDAAVYPWTNGTIPLGLVNNRWSVVYAANGTINTSDVRLKENIVDLSYGLASILQLKPVSFTWKGEADAKVRLGLLAQDVEKVINEVVDKGNDPSQTLGINYSELVPVLIKGIQDQQKQIESQERKNLELESEIKLLREEMEQVKSIMARNGNR